MNAQNAAEQSASEEKSKGQLFKEKYGYSKTMKRLMKKYNCSTVQEYRKIRKNARRARSSGVKQT